MLNITQIVDLFTKALTLAMKTIKIKYSMSEIYNAQIASA